MFPILASKIRGLVPRLIPYVATLAAGIAAGWWLKPARVEERLKVVEVEKQVVVEKEVVRVEVVRVKDTAVAERWHREKTEERRPDGTVFTREVEDRNVDTVVKERENTVEVKVVEVEKQVVVDRVTEKTATPVLPAWRTTTLVGLQVDDWSAIRNPPLVVGGALERRVAGPFYLGAWMTTRAEVPRGLPPATVGVSVTAEF